MQQTVTVNILPLNDELRTQNFYPDAYTRTDEWTFIQSWYIELFYDYFLNHKLLTRRFYKVREWTFT